LHLLVYLLEYLCKFVREKTRKNFTPQGLVNFVNGGMFETTAF
jgi:hypothetical protein